jgi:hypothetical protein
MDTPVVELTELVVIGNVADSEPAGTVILGGTVALEVSLLARATTVPPVGATPFRVTVPVDPYPPVTDAGVIVTAVRVLAWVMVPFTAISARPMFWPTAVFTVNCIHVVVLGLKVTVNGEPSLGRAPTETVVPSLNDNVPDVTLSTRFGLSYKTTWEAVTGTPQVSLIHAPANWPSVAHSFV